MNFASYDLGTTFLNDVTLISVFELLVKDLHLN